MKRTILIIVTIILLITISGCAINNNNNNQTVKVKENLNVGVVIPLTGAGAPLGEDFLKGLELAKHKINPNITFYVVDSKSNPADGVSATMQLINTHDIDVLVSLQSAVVMSLVEISEQNDIPLLATAIARDDFAKDSNYTFRLYPAASIEGKLAADYMFEQDYEKVGVITLQDAFGTSFRDSFEESFQGEIVYKEDFMISNTDYRMFLTEMKDVDAIYFIGYPFHHVNLLKQREELGLDVPIFSTAHIQSNYVKSQSVGLLHNTYATVPFAAISNGKFSEEFESMHGKKSDWTAPFGYDTVVILNEVEKSGLEPRGALYNIEVEGLLGTINFDQYGETDIPLTVVDALSGDILI